MAGIKDFSRVGGLEKHIRIVKEMVLFPLMYGDVYAKFNLRPPRGLLFYGPPGTGKTLVASALAVECSNSGRKVAFISRKGSDCLGKFVGESEKKLQHVFQMAHKNRPCIIFFDEVDGLAPVRSDRQDFVHASVVSILLALMDGLDSNSGIIVIGATNRIDAIDPALRRPGRFDRELYFPLPCYAARKDILSIHVKSWKQKPPQKFIAYLASKTVGFCGCDLQALCTEAVMCCLRRNYPQIYTTKSKYHINERTLKVEKLDFVRAQQNIVPASHRISIAPVKTLSTEIRPLLHNRLMQIMANLYSICPTEMINSEDSERVASHSTNCPRMLLYGSDDCHTRHLGPAVLHTLEHLPCHMIDVTSLFEDTAKAPEESIIQKFKAARHTLPSLVYVPDILAWWDLVEEAARVVFTSLIRGLDRSVQILVLVTARCYRSELPQEISDMFNEYRGEMFEIEKFTPLERENFFYELFIGVDSTPDNNLNAASGEPAEPLDFPIPMTTRTRAKNIQRSRSESTSLTTPVTSSGKRDNGGIVDSPPSKKRLRGNNSVAVAQPANHGKSGRGVDKLTDSQIQDLVVKLVKQTEGWTSVQLENLQSYLEWVMDNQDSDVYNAINECLSYFETETSFRYLQKQPKIEKITSRGSSISNDFAAGES